MRIAVIGSGAIGGIVGGYLSRDGMDIVLVDRSEAHVQAMQENGLLIDGKFGETICPVNAVLPDQLQGKFDVILLAVKSQHTKDALATAVTHLDDAGMIVSLQNGLANKRVIAEAIGKERTIGAMVRLSAGFTGPGHVTQLSEGLIVVGHLDGSSSEMLDKVGEIIGRVVECNVSDNLYGWLWAKEVYNAFLLPATIVGVTKTELIEYPETEPVVIATMKEYANIANAEGIRFEQFDYLNPRALLDDSPAALEEIRGNLRTIVERFGNTKGGMYRDIVVRKIPIELDYTAGEISRIGKKHGISIPLLDRMIEMIFEIERGEREMSHDNLIEVYNLLQ